MPRPARRTTRCSAAACALKSPFGTFYPPNISSDPTDGIGGWSEAQFITAMTKGTSPQGEHLYPAFPYTSYQHITYNDLRDLFAYLKTLPAVKGRAPPHALSFPFNIRRLIGGWKLLYLDGLPFQPDPAQSDEWNRGAYLVNGPGHCAECHSPRNFLGGIVASERFAGGPGPDGKGWVPNITQKALAKWSVEDIAYLLESGFTPDGDSVGSTMGEVVKNTSQLSDGRPQGDRHLHQIAAAGRRPAEAGEKVNHCHSGARAKAREPGIQKRTARLASGFRVPAFGRPRNDFEEMLHPPAKGTSTP